MLLSLYKTEQLLLQQLPQPLIHSLQTTPGFDEEAFIKVHEESEAVTSIRYNPEKLITVDIQLPLQPVPWCPLACYLPERPSFTFDPLFHAGLYYVQEASSMFLWQVLQQTVGGNTSGKKVLDLCAAPGGKSTLLASYFTNGLLVANEVIKSRANILAENITKWGMGNVVVTNNDPVHFQRLENSFDVMVIDAPCSGSGLFRKDKEAVEEWSEDAVQLCSARQHRIVAYAYPCLAQDGLLIYSTCSYSEEEDENVLDWMVDHFGLTSIPIQLQEEWNIVETKSSKHNAYGYRFYPDKVKGEGFFIAAFTKKDGGHFYPSSYNALSLLSKREGEIWQPWIASNKSLFLIRQKQFVIALPDILQNHLPLLQKALYIKQAGILLGEVKGKDVIPHHALAVSTIVNPSIQSIDFTKEQAIQYLQKKDIHIDTSSLSKGWHLATYCGIGLGWVKVLPNRINNYYPTEWRILKN